MELWLVLVGVAVAVGVAVGALGGGGGLAEVRRWVEEGRWERACGRLKAMLARRKADPEARWLLSRCWEGMGDWQHAVVEQKILLRDGVFGRRVPRDEVLKAMARNYARLRRPAEGLKAVEDELGRRDSWWGRLWKVRFLVMLGRASEAVADVERLLRERGGEAVVLAEAGIVYLKTGRTGPGRESLEAALRADRKLFRAWFYLGEHYREHREWDRAVEAFENAKHDRGLRSEALWALARCYRAKGMEKNAMEVLERLTEEWESDAAQAQALPPEFMAEVRYELAELCLYHKDYQGALDQWRTIEATLPGFRDVAAKIQANARYGRDRIQDFLIAGTAEFEKFCRFVAERSGGVTESRQVEAGERAYLVVRTAQGGRVMVGVWRSETPVGEAMLEEFLRRMKAAGVAEGWAYSARGFTANAVRHALERPVRLFGEGPMMRLLKEFENRFHDRS